MNKAYLGDGVYAQVSAVSGIDGTVVLTTENGIRATNRIVLEPEVLKALMLFLKREGFTSR